MNYGTVGLTIRNAGLVKYFVGQNLMKLWLSAKQENITNQLLIEKNGLFKITKSKDSTNRETKVV